MHILRRRGWELPERLVTPEARCAEAAHRCWPVRARSRLRRRRWRRARDVHAQPEISAGPRDHAEKYATTYNNYYEFGEGKNLWQAAQALKQRPWSIRLDGHGQTAAHASTSMTC